MTNWATVFDEIGVEWRDRGPNTSRDHVNIACPWCGNDPSFHLSIALTKDAYACRRDRRHYGTSPVGLLHQLGVRREDAIALVNRHENSGAPVRVVEVQAPSELARKWSFFRPASESAPMTEYLTTRGFDAPASVANRYDLRYAPGGIWSLRLLLPFFVQDELLGWTGRTVAPRLVPKYLNEGATSAGTVYQPRIARRRVILVEGPLDALKVAVATEDRDISVIALTGKALPTARVINIARLIGNAERLSVCLDADANPAEAMSLFQEVRGGLAFSRRTCIVDVLRLPQGFKDPGEMPLAVIREWLE